MLRAAALLSLLRRILRFSTTGRPAALGACYVASWQLPRLDSHQLADDSLQGTPASCQVLLVMCHGYDDIPLLVPFLHVPEGLSSLLQRIASVYDRS